MEATKTAARPKSGQRVTARNLIYKVHHYDTIDKEIKVNWKRGVHSTFERVQEEPLIDGIYIGYRDVKEGVIVYNGEDEQNGFTPHRTIRVWLIVQNERRNPVHVLPEDVTWDYQ